VASLTKDQILSADDLGLLKVDVPEWGGAVHIRVMAVSERDAYEREWIGKKETGVENFRTKFLQRVLCDEAGNLLFTASETDKLAQKSARVMTRLWEKAMKHNALMESDVQELAKN
jgi:NADH:ubiquinone oxidoreductase subunit